VGAGYPRDMTERTPDPRDPDEHDQDAEPTMTAPPEQRPDAGASALDPGGRADTPDVVDADEGADGGADSGADGGTDGGADQRG
jgi:hypothetical protein